VPLPLLPDTVALAIQALGAQSVITALVGARIYDRVPASPVYPLLEVLSVDDGESAGEPIVGESRVQVNCWGAGTGPGHVQQTRLIARTVRAVCRDLVGTHAAGRIVSAAPVLFVPAPDETGRARFIIDLSLRTF
jgi:Protein of unknown function (DUF3168)